MLDPALDQMLVAGTVALATGYLLVRFFRRRKAGRKACDSGTCCTPAGRKHSK